MVAWRVARSLDTLLAQINTAHPARSKTSDGAIGDTAHSGRTSAHNPDQAGVVRARDFTHDPPRFDAHAFADTLRTTRDPRIDHVISNRRIFSARVQPWTWRAYTGTNPHTKHVHVAVVTGARADDTTPWAGVSVGEPEDDMTPEQARQLGEVYRLVAGLANPGGPFLAAKVGERGIGDQVWGHTLGEAGGLGPAAAATWVQDTASRVAALLAHPEGRDLDEENIARLVLEVLSPQAIAAAIPSAMAASVVDELRDRL